MKSARRVLWAALVAVLTTAAPALAGPIVIDAGWYGFCFGGSGTGATDGCLNEAVDTSGNPFTFVAAADVLLKVTDAFQHGDTFRVFDFGVLLFVTPDVAVTAGSVTNPDLAYADPLYSHGSAVLGAGAHSITIFVDDSPYGLGGAYTEVETAVPEPTSLALFGGAMAAMGAYRRRRRQA